MNMKTFQTHTGEIVTGERLNVAYGAVADWYVENAHGIKSENLYASHVTEKTKQDCLDTQLALAERIRLGIEPMGFWLWQRLNTELTGECVAFLPKTKPKTKDA